MQALLKNSHRVVDFIEALTFDFRLAMHKMFMCIVCSYIQSDELEDDGDKDDCVEHE